MLTRWPKLSRTHGQPYEGILLQTQNTRKISSLNTSLSDELIVDIYRQDSGVRILSNARVTVATTGTQLNFSLADFAFQTTPYKISLVAIGPKGRIFTANTQLFRLPNRTDGGSITKIDNLSGALLVQQYVSTAQDGFSASNPLTSRSKPDWTALFPYSFYVDGVWLGQSPENLKLFKDYYGNNVLHLVPGGGPVGYNLTELEIWLDEADQLGLWVMYDMRWIHQNQEELIRQVNRLKKRRSFLLWYTADEPGAYSLGP